MVRVLGLGGVRRVSLTAQTAALAAARGGGRMEHEATRPGVPNEGTARVTYLQPDEPPEGTAAVAAIVTVAGQDFPLTIRGTRRDGELRWDVAFGDLADEGRYDTFAAALRAAHTRAQDDAGDLVRALRDGGY